MNRLSSRIFSTLVRRQKQRIYSLDLLRHSFKIKDPYQNSLFFQKLEDMKFLVAVKLSNMLQQRSINSSSGDDGNKEKRKPPVLMNFIPVMRPQILLSLRNWILATFIIQPYLDKDFSLKEFTEGSKQALVIVSSYLSQGDFQSLKGLVTDDAIAEIKRNYSSLNIKERQDLLTKFSDIFISFPYQIGIIFDDDNQKRYAEITVVYHIIKNLEDMKMQSKVNSEAVKDDIKICNYRFIREYTKGVESDWTINRLGHFKLCHFEE
ncbi:m-AAA protease-interacting protein 1, mitochondrial-like [Argiope bruennichi]|uniref:m-AAA protease-interacting protein 1, mitochondrial-like n=1 Tax=Argiope bruennichi TaxID=94029 RepID=UPI0024942400|nr:m-AAA protease-interacting protein 1, mitochondrial-like [Argiope bruennichi]